MIKAIETKYNGYSFRSRTEAKWAYVFDRLNIKYLYENEGYELENGDWYLPDFYLPNHGFFIEIKGATPSQTELDKCSFLANGLSKPVVMAIGNPDDFNSLCFYGYNRPTGDSADQYFYDYYYTDIQGMDDFVSHGLESGWNHDVSGSLFERIDKTNILRHNHDTAKNNRFILPNHIKGSVFKSDHRIINLCDNFQDFCDAIESAKSYKF